MLITTFNATRFGSRMSRPDKMIPIKNQFSFERNESIATIDVEPPDDHEPSMTLQIMERLSKTIQHFGKYPIMIYCPFCNEIAPTKTATAWGCLTHVLALLLCVTGCVCFVWFPYFCRCTKHVDHYCSKCGAYLGRHKMCAPF
ncbi:hypothetical protein Trydic_g22398 [Trypoxylus dichotomus]